MPRLPQPGADNGTWGDILNEYLSQSLKPDGTLQDNAVTANTVAPNSITNSALASNAVNAAIIEDGSITETLLDAALKSKINTSADVSSVAGKTGVVLLDKNDVGLGNIDNTSDTDKPISTATQSALSGKVDKVTTPARIYGVNGAGADTVFSYGSPAAASSFVRRDSDGRAQFAEPAVAADAASKGYVDTAVTGMVTLTGTQTLTNKTLTSPRVNQLLDANGNSIVETTGATTPVNWLRISNGATGVGPSISARGSDANVNLDLLPKGTGAIVIRDSANSWVFRVAGPGGTAVNYINVTSAITGSGPTIQGTGNDTNVDLNFTTKGTGVVRANGAEILTISGTQTLTNKTLTNPRINAIYDVNGSLAFLVTQQTNAVNYLETRNGPTGSAAQLRATGNDTDVNLWLVPKNSGNIGVYANTGLVPTIAAVGADTNHDLALVPKGTGSIRLGGGAILAQNANLTLYNTSDQTTNYERVRQYWSTNVAYISTENGGTGTARNLFVGVANAQRGLVVSAVPTSSGRFQFAESTTNSSAVGVSIVNTFSSSSSGIQTGLLVSANVNQSSTAGYTTLMVSSTETTMGSGSKLLADFQVGGSSKTRIDNTGTHILSGGANIQSYNTTDETTNYERARHYWSSSVYTIGTEFGGTGGVRNMELKANGVVFRIRPGGSTAGLWEFASGLTSANNVGVNISGSYTASSGVNPVMAIQPTINQSSTAGYTGLLINPTETTTGSGAKNLIDAQVGGVSMFSVSNSGQTVQGNYALTTPVLHLKGGASGNSMFRFSRGSGVTASGQYDFSLAGGGFAIAETLSSGRIALNSFADASSARIVAGQEGSIGNYSAITGIVSASTHAAGAGSNIGGPALVVQGGGGTGTGTPGSIQFKTFSTTTAGANVQSSTTRMTIAAGSGEVTIASPGSSAGSVVSVDGTQTLTNKTWGDNLNMNSHRITSVTDPTSAQDAATKNYVDTNAVTTSGVATLTNKTLTNPRINQIHDTNGNNLLGLYTIGSAVNQIYVTNQSTGNWPTLGVDGADTNIGLSLAPKGNGAVRIYAQSGLTPTFDVAGPDTNIDLNLVSKGNGVVKVNGNQVATVVNVPASATATGSPGQIAYDVNYIYVCTAPNTWIRSAAGTW